MRETSTDKILVSVSETRRLAEHLLLSLESALLSQIADEREAQRYVTRLRFSLARVDELRRVAIADGGVFAASRLEVAESILTTHTVRAADFVAATVQRMRRERVRAGERARISKDATVAIVDDVELLQAA